MHDIDTGIRNATCIPTVLTPVYSIPVLKFNKGVQYNYGLRLYFTVQ